MEEKKEINIEDARKYYEFLNHNGKTELRLLKPKWEEEKVLTPSFFVDNEEDFIGVIKKYNGVFDIYAGINSRIDEGKSDDDIKYITNIGHDIDAHGSGTEGLKKAGEIIMEIKASCEAQGYEEPLIVSSGHGYWIIHHLSPIENTKENIAKIKEFGKRVKKLHEKEGTNIDTSVYNPSRIIRVAGTLNLREKNNFVLSFLMNNPLVKEDEKLKQDILNIELPKFEYNLSSSIVTPTLNSFMDYCLTHEIPKGERHKIISRHIALYISDNPNREILREQYIKIQRGSETELDQWLKQIDENGKEKYPFSIGQLINFTRKYQIPFNWTIIPEYKIWKQEQRANQLLQKEVDKEIKAEKFGKAIKFFIDKKHLAKEFLKVQPLYYDGDKLWWIWIEEKKCWVLCDETDIMNKISEHSEANTISSKEKNEILEALKQEARLNKPKEMEKSWIQFKNKIYDIYTEEIIDATSEYFTTNPIPFELSNEEDTPTIDKIFEEWLGNKNIEILYEIIAYCLLRDYPIHRIFCFIGSGMNGKSKYLDLIKRFIGSENCCSTELDNLITSRFEVARLHKKLVCQMGETNFGELSKTSMIKKLSGGDLIGFEYKGKNPFEDKNYAKILISTNNLPSTTDKTIGFYRRWLIIDFPNQFNEKKDILLDIPPEEYINLTRKCCSTLKRLLNEREFTNEGSIEQRMVKYEEKSNFLMVFLNNFIEESFSSYITKAEFYKKFNQWCKENRHRELSETSVGLNLKKLNISESKRYFDWLFDGKGGQLRVWEGIKWK